MPEWIDPSTLSIPVEVLRQIPARIAHRDHVLPIRWDGELLVVAVQNPTDSETIDRLRFVLNREIRPVGLPLAELKLAIWRFYGPVE